MSSLSPKISVVIPAYNAAKFISDTINSLRRQSYENWECIIVDDRSADDTAKIVKKICENESRVSFEYRPTHLIKGANSCRNYGLGLASGEFVQWFDADDLMHPTMLREKSEALQNNDIDFVINKGAKFKGEIENIVGYWEKLLSDDPLVDQAIGKIDFQTNSVMLKLSFLKKHNLLWNEKLTRKQDYEFFSRVLSKSCNFHVLDKILYYYRVHSRSMSVVDSKNSIASLVKADILVYNILKNKNKADFLVKRHFIRKSVGRLNRSISDRKIGASLMSLRNIIGIIDWNYIMNKYERRS